MSSLVSKGETEVGSTELRGSGTSHRAEPEAGSPVGENETNPERSTETAGEEEEGDFFPRGVPTFRNRALQAKSTRKGSLLMRGGRFADQADDGGAADEFMKRRDAMLQSNPNFDSGSITKELWRARLLKVTQSKLYTIVFVLATVYALFIGDVKVLLLPSSADQGIEIALFVCLILFVVEIAVLSFVEDGYFGGTFFYLDIIAGLSLIFDISFIFPSETETTSLTVARAGRAARIGSRAGRVGRILRIVRLMRMLRMFRLFKFLFKKKKRTLNPLGNNVKVEVPNQLSRASTEIVSRRVVVLVLVVMLAVTLLQYFEADLSAQAALQGLIAYNATVIKSPSLSAQQPAYRRAFDTSVQTYRDLFEGELLYFQLFETVYENNQDALDSRRPSEIQSFVSEETDTKATLDRLSAVQEESAYSLGIIGCIIIILIAASFVFSKDSHALIGKPVRDMISAREVSEGLLRVFKVVTDSESSSEHILRTVAETLCHVISATRVTLFLIDKTNEEVWCQVSASILDTTSTTKVAPSIRVRERQATELFNQIRLPLDDEVVGKAACTGEVVLINDVVQNDSLFDASAFLRRMQGARIEDGAPRSPARSSQVAPETGSRFASPHSTHAPEPTNQSEPRASPRSGTRRSMLRKDMVGTSVRNLGLDQEEPQFDDDQEIWRRSFRLPKKARYDAFFQHNVSTVMCMRINDPAMPDKGLAVLQVINKIGDGKDTVFTPNDEAVLRTFSAQIAAVIKNSSHDAVFTNAVSKSNSGALPNLLAQYTTAAVHKRHSQSAAGTSPRGESGSAASGRSRVASVPPHARPLPNLSDQGTGSRKGKFLPGSVIGSQDDLAEESGGRNSPPPESTESPKHSTMESTAGALQRARGVAFTPVPWQNVVSAKTLSTWEFDPLSLERDQLATVAVGIMEQLSVLDRFRVRPLKARMFADRILAGYHDVPYHNAFHAISVLHVSYMVLTSTTSARASLRSIDVFALAVAALGHDNGHRGMNNSFHTATLRTDTMIPELALTYNDQSVLENLHARNTFSVLIQPEVDISSRLTPGNKSAFRKSVIGGILATDMTHHFHLTKELAAKAAFDVEKTEDRQMLLNAIIHSADLANPILPPARSVDLTLRVTKEFQNQAQTERRLGLPVNAFMDIKGPVTRDNVGVAKNEMGFTEFVVMPLWRAMNEFFPELSVCMDHAQQNLEFWRHVNKTGIVYDEDGNEVDVKARNAASGAKEGK